MVFQRVNKQALYYSSKSSPDQYEEKCYGTKGKMNLHKEKYVLKEKDEIACRRLEGLFTLNFQSWFSQQITVVIIQVLQPFPFIWKKVSRVISFLSNVTVNKLLNFFKPQHAH